jgi:SSS family solute:Na+ symporter
MKRYTLLIILLGFSMLVFLTGCGNSAGTTITISDSLRQKAVQVIRLNMENQHQWVKVHAAEDLLLLGYTKGVKDLFQSEEAKYGNQSPYRIGIWRVLAEANPIPEKKKIWISRILSAYEDTNSSDRAHAAETLAKLNISPSTECPETAKKILSGAINPLSIYTLWADESAAAKDPIKNTPNALLQILNNDREDIQSKRIVSYALRHLDNLSFHEWNSLAQIALSKSGESGIRSNLLSTALITTPNDSVQSMTYLRIRDSLVQYKNSPNIAERLDLTEALAEKGVPEDLNILISFMDKRGNDLNDPDLQTSSSYAILRIDRRSQPGLSAMDWTVIIVYLLGMFAIGFYYYRKNKSENDFFLGGGQMNPILVGLSLFSTFTSAITYLAGPGEMIKHGPVFFIGIISFPFIYYVVGWFIIPRIKKFNVTSGYEILEIKLGISIRMLATLLFLSLRFLWMATIIYVSVNIVIFPVFKIDPSYSIIVGAILMLFTILYTSIGGLKAVIVTDAIQALILFGGALIVILTVSIHFGSLTSWLPNHWLAQWGKFDIRINMRDRSSIGAVVLMNFIWYVASAASDQMSIQRFLATKDVKSAKKTFGISLWANIIGLVLLGLVGLALFAYFTANPQYLSNKNDLNNHADLLFPRFMVIGLPMGVSGLMVAAVLAATMSSLSSGVNSCASVVTEDIIKRFWPKIKKSNNELKQVQKLSLLIGLIVLLLSFAIPYVKGNLLDIAMKVVNLLVSPLFVLFFMALFVPFATSRGTFIGGVASVVIAVAIAFFNFMELNVFFISIASLLVGIVVGVFCSFIDSKIFGNRDTASNRNEY